MRRPRATAYAALMVLTSVACDDVGCRWTDDPPEPIENETVPMVAHDTDHGRFRVTLDEPTPWPLAPGPQAVTLQVEGAASTAIVEAEAPYHADSGVEAPPAPTVELDAVGAVVLSGFDLPEPGLWLVPLQIADDTTMDTFELGLRVE